eukprot:SAG25_NODE_357_length_9189_cov_5.378218_7_plen_152_part_00
MCRDLPFFRAPIAAKQPTRQTVHPRTGASPLPRGGPRCASGAAGAGGEGTAHGELQRAGGEGPCRLRDGDCTGWSHLEAPRGWRCRGTSSYRPVATAFAASIYRFARHPFLSPCLPVHPPAPRTARRCSRFADKWRPRRMQDHGSQRHRSG